MRDTFPALPGRAQARLLECASPRHLACEVAAEMAGAVDLALATLACPADERDARDGSPGPDRGPRT